MRHSVCHIRYRLGVRCVTTSDNSGEFEGQEEKLFGDEGFLKIVDQVANVERQLGIYDLDQFTPILSEVK